jgi:FkbM family methyltransferase
VAKAAWGDWLQIEPRKFIGAHVYMRGVHELPVCELLWRLAEAGERVLDVGANIGVMTSLLSKRVGESGRVLAFEAHPRVFQQLSRNVRFWNRSQIEISNRAISNHGGTVRISEGDDFGTNEGTARVEKDETCAKGLEVDSAQLDEVMPTGVSGVTKIDVEGHEVEVLTGAKTALAERRMRDIVFESGWGFPGAAHDLLVTYGYQVFALHASLWGPKLTEMSNRPEMVGRQADYLATLDSRRALALVKPRGWRTLRR